MIPTFIHATPGTYTGPAPTKFQNLLNIVAQNTDYEWEEQGNVTIYAQRAGPGDPLGIWFRDDPSGNPLGVFVFFNGAWRPLPQGGDVTGLKYFSGNWTLYFDGTGRGIVNTPWDGYALCNGQNGTPDLSNTFLVPGSFYLNGAWETQIEVVGTYKAKGGQSKTALSLANLPTLTWQILLEEEFYGQKATGGVYIISTDTGPSAGLDPQTAAAITMFDPSSVGGFQPIYTLPPYTVLGVAMWVGF